MSPRRDRPLRTKRSSHWPGTILSVSIASAAALFLAADGIVQSVVGASFFRVEEVQVVWPEDPPQRYRLKPPRSIFTVDLAAVSDALAKTHPSAEVTAVRRVLPNHLVATLRMKKVLAQVRAERYYPVSSEGAVLAQGRSAPFSNLPIIFLERIKGSLQVGGVLTGASFSRALELLAMIHRQGGIQGHRVNSVKSSDRELSLLMDSGVEVRFSPDDVEAGWQRWMRLVAHRPEVLAQARYLDLRFEDPVVGQAPGPKAKRRK